MKYTQVASFGAALIAAHESTHRSGGSDAIAGALALAAIPSVSSMQSHTLGLDFSTTSTNFTDTGLAITTNANAARVLFLAMCFAYGSAVLSMVFIFEDHAAATAFGMGGRCATVVTGGTESQGTSCTLVAQGAYGNKLIHVQARVGSGTGTLMYSYSTFVTLEMFK